jgi:hypothetical protein
VPRRRWFLGWLVAALLAAPALGHMHRIVHGPQAHLHAHAQEHEARHAHGDEAGLHGVAALFAVHDDDSTCRLFDQLGHGDALGGVPALVLPLLLVSFLFRRFSRDAVAREAALFDARGPPALR